MNYGLHIIKYPSGRYGFVGNVPVHLSYVNHDGTRLTDAQVSALRTTSNPAFIAKTRSFATEAEAIAAQEYELGTNR